MTDVKVETIAPILAGFAILGTVLGMVLRGWSSIKGFVHSAFRLVVTQVHLQDEATSQAVLAHLIRAYRRSTLCEKTFGGRHESFRDGKFGHIPFEFFGGHRVLFWVGRVPLWFNVTAEKSPDKSVIYWGEQPKPAMKSSLSFLRGTVDVEGIVRAASAARNHLYWANGLSEQMRFFIKRVPDATQVGRQRYSAGTNLAWYQEGFYRLLAHTADQLGKGTSPLARAARPTSCTSRSPSASSSARSRCGGSSRTGTRSGTSPGSGAGCCTARPGPGRAPSPGPSPKTSTCRCSCTPSGR
ncbi:MAG TPA: hypothetical protein VH092_15085 [Urbifossiella sp.]|jgi:hypothetical protein|nr:hypothetical protein [Urbifossiella sp.]